MNSKGAKKANDASKPIILLEFSKVIFINGSPQ